MLARLLQIQRGEGRSVGLVVGFMFVAVAGLTVGESGISALFFENVGADALPVMYLVQAAVGVTGMLVLSAVIGRFDRRRTYVWLPMLLAGLVVLERVLVETDASWGYWVLYLTTSIAYLVQAIYLWGAAGLVTDARRAKRLFPLFAAGNILGAVVGGLVTQPLANAIGAANLLVVWAISLVVVTLACVAIVGRSRATARHRHPPSAIGELARGFAAVRRSPLLVWMSVAATLFSVLFSSLYLPYAEAATARFPDPDELAGFFGIFWAGVTGVAFLASILLTNRLIGRFGAAILVVILPLLYGGAFAILLVTATFGALVAIRFAVNVWLQGVASPAWETVTNVTPEERRDQIRAFLNGGPSQIGTAIAGAIAIVGLSTRQLAIVGLVAAAITVVATWRMRREYPSALIDAIRSGRPRVFDEPLRAPFVLDRDAAATEVAVEALADPDPRVRRLATSLLAGGGDGRTVAALREALRDDDAFVRAEAFAALGGSLRPEDASAAASDPDPGVRLALARTADPAKLPTALLDDPDPSVVAAAAARTDDVRANERIRELVSRSDAETRVAVVRELAAVGTPRAAGLAGDLREDPSPAVRAAAIEALAGGGTQVVADAALAGLADEDPAVVDASLRALGAVDTAPIADQLDAVVEDRARRAAEDGRRAGSLPADGDATELLRDTLLARGRGHALVALSAAAVTSNDADDLGVALDILREGDPSQLANALEAVESAVGANRARALLGLWETSPDERAAPGSLDEVADDPDPFVRAIVEFVHARSDGGDAMTKAEPSMTSVERVLALRRIEMFSALEPKDLQRVADIADERSYVDGDVLGHEGEAGDELHIIVDGTVRVMRGGDELARRSDGDVIGEMSLLTRAPRVASLIADGDVRTVRIGHREFGAMIRERPDIALAVMRTLAERLATASGVSGSVPA